MSGFAKAALGFAALIGIAVALAECQGPPASGSSCLERLERMKRMGERYSGEFDQIVEDCEPDRIYGRY